jgi:putative membrane protein
MGIAEAVPGVSGGTIAFITGIYLRLVTAISRFGPRSLRLVGTPSEFAKHHDLAFLVTLAAGMGFGLVLFARLMRYLLAYYQPLVWAFFFGVIAMSVVVIGKERVMRSLVVWAPIGLLLGLVLVSLPAQSEGATLWQLFFGSAVAVCAWILPAVSGSYVLLALGMYEQVIGAVAGLEWSVLLVVGGGCALGLLLFSKLLAWLMARHYEPVLSLLTGFMLGSLFKLWPWQIPADSVWSAAMTPHGYAAATGEASHLAGAVASVTFGAITLWLLHRFTAD